MRARTMVVAGVMSGTSVDGVDVAFAKISPGKTMPKLDVLGHRGFAYPRALRDKVMRVMEGETMPAAELSRLHWRLGELYAECVEQTCRELGVMAELVGLHGQTVYHQGAAAKFLGRPVRATWQMGEASVVRERMGVPVISDFRPADLAAGGQGAPLVPMLDFCMLRSTKRGRILLNLGGIANVTVIPAGASLADVVAFDTGPGNMVMDSIMRRSFGKPFDRGGKVAARGRVLHDVLREAHANPYFKAAPPKSCGREQFGDTYAYLLLGQCQSVNGTPADAVRIAAELTAETIASAVQRFCMPLLSGAPVEVIAAGGGTRNAWIMRRLEQLMRGVSLGTGSSVEVKTLETLGLNAQAKEAVAFALLAWLSWHRMPGNVPSATGARGPRVLGKVSW